MKTTLLTAIFLVIACFAIILTSQVNAATVDTGSWTHLTPVRHAHEPDIWFKAYTGSSASPEAFSVVMPDYNTPGWNGVSFDACEIQYQTSTATGDMAVAVAYTFVDSTGYDADAAYDSLRATLTGLDSGGIVSVWYIDIR